MVIRIPWKVVSLIGVLLMGPAFFQMGGSWQSWFLVVGVCVTATAIDKGVREEECKKKEGK